MIDAVIRLRRYAGPSTGRRRRLSPISSNPSAERLARRYHAHAFICRSESCARRFRYDFVRERLRLVYSVCSLRQCSGERRPLLVLGHEP